MKALLEAVRRHSAAAEPQDLRVAAAEAFSASGAVGCSPANAAGAARSRPQGSHDASACLMTPFEIRCWNITASFRTTDPTRLDLRKALKRPVAAMFAVCNPESIASGYSIGQHGKCREFVLFCLRLLLIFLCLRVGLLLLGADSEEHADGTAALALEAWALALQLTEDEDDAVRRAVSAALGAAVAADAGVSAAEQVRRASTAEYALVVMKAHAPGCRLIWAVLTWLVQPAEGPC